MQSKISLIFLSVLSFLIVIGLTYFPLKLVAACTVGVFVGWITLPIYVFFKLAEGIDNDFYYEIEEC